MTLVRRGNRKASGPFVVDADALPQTIDVVRTRAEAMGIDVVVADLAEGLPEGDLCGVVVQYPGASGRIIDPRGVIDQAHERSEEHTYELQSLMRISYAVFCLKKKKTIKLNN